MDIIIFKNKKAMIFTLLAIAIISLFLASYGVYSISNDRKSINKRIETMNNFVFSIEENLPRQLFITSFRIIFLFEKRIVETGSYITNLNATFKETFYNGTIYQESQELMEGVTFPGIVESINEKAKEINVNVSFTNSNITVTQVDPWNVKVILEAQMLVKDISDLAQWNKTIKISAYIPITTFEDPLYLINTNGMVINKINRTIYESFVTGSDVSNLTGHYENSYYINSTLAPSFLDRLEGKDSANENGIESLVYLPKLQTQGIEKPPKSVVDYIYFSTNNPTSFQIEEMPLSFRIDSNHLDVYQVSGITV